MAPVFFRRMDPSTAGTVGFLIRLTTMAVTLLAALWIAQVSPGAILAGSAFTAVIIGLAAQQTLGNLFAGMVLISARPFRVGERIRLQAGAVGGSVEGVVSSLGLLYTTLVRGEERTMIPNTVVLAAAVVPIREPDSVDVRVRLTSGIRPSHVQELLDSAITVPTRSRANVLLEEVDGDEVVVRIQATPERSDDGARLADEIIVALAPVTGQHEVVRRLTRVAGCDRGLYSMCRWPAARSAAIFSPPIRRLRFEASPGATEARLEPTRRNNGATSTSPRFRSIARRTPRATCSGVARTDHPR